MYSKNIYKYVIYNNIKNIIIENISKNIFNKKNPKIILDFSNNIINQ